MVVDTPKVRVTVTGGVVLPKIDVQTVDCGRYFENLLSDYVSFHAATHGMVHGGIYVSGLSPSVAVFVYAITRECLPEWKQHNLAQL